MRPSKEAIARAARAITELWMASDGRASPKSLAEAALEAAMEPGETTPSEATIDHMRMCGHKGRILRFGLIKLES